MKLQKRSGIIKSYAIKTMDDLMYAVIPFISNEQVHLKRYIFQNIDKETLQK